MTHPQYAAPDQRFGSHAEFYQNSVYSQFQQEHRTGGSFSLSMMEVEQEPFDLIDAPVPDFVFYQMVTDIEGVLVDMGDGAYCAERLQKGKIDFIPPMTETRYRIDEVHTIRMLCLPARTVEPLLEAAGLSTNSLYHMLPGQSDDISPEAIRLTSALWAASKQGGLSTNLLLDGLTLQFLAVATSSNSLSPITSDRAEDVRVMRVVDYIETYLGEPLMLADLAAVACLSPGHFSRTFKATTGEAVWAYVLRRRCERAHEMLLLTKTPIAQIAYACGFSNQAHFTTAFKQTYGVTPGSMRVR